MLILLGFGFTTPLTTQTTTKGKTMPKFELFDGTNVIKAKSFPNATGHISKADAMAKGKPWWLEVINSPRPDFDDLTHHKPVRLAPVRTDTTATYGWAAPVAKTQQEMDDEAAADMDREFNTLTRNAPVTEALFRGWHRLNNRVRALEGKNAWTLAQTKAYLKGLVV